MEEIKCLIVNWDGVCVSTEKARHLAYCETFHQLGQTDRIWSERDTVAQSGRNPDKIWADDSLWKGQGKEAKKIFYNAYNFFLNNHLFLNDNARSFLTMFKVWNPKVPVVCFGAKSQTEMEHEVERLSLTNSFDLIYGSKEGSTQNKDLDKPVALCAVLQKLELTADAHVLYLGYKESDKRAARFAGIEYQKGSDFMQTYLNQHLKTKVISQKMPKVMHNEHTKE